MRYTTTGLLLLALLLGVPDPARSLPATCIPLPFPTTPTGTVFTLPIFFGSGQGKLELWRQACQDGSGQTAMLVRATPFTASVHVCSPTILQNGIQFQGRLAPGPGQSFCDSLFIPQTFILVELGGTPQFNGAAAFSLINDGIPATRIDVPAAESVPPPPSYALTVNKLGSGTGTVASGPAGIDCGADCSESYTSSTPVTLTATPTGGSTFGGWGGDCTSFGTTTTCSLTMTAAKTASATFTAPPPPDSYNFTRTFLTTDPITVEHTYYDPNDACLGVSPATLKFFVFNLEGQLVLGRNRNTTGGVTNTQIGTSKYLALLASLDPGTLPPGAYNLIFRVEDCTATSVYVSGFYAIEVFAAP